MPVLSKKIKLFFQNIGSKLSWLIFLNFENLKTPILFSNPEYSNDPKLLRDLFEKVKESYPKEWLLLLEIMEVSKNAHLIKSIHKHLEQLIILNSKLSSLITDGIQILKIDDQ